MLKNIEVTQDLLDYIYNHTHPLHPVQKDILTHNKTLGDIERMQISEIQGHFLQLIIKINNVKSCLEIGTFTGFSTLTMALALPNGGKIITLDHDEKIVHVAKNLSALIKMITSGKISGKIAKDVFEKMQENNKDPQQIVEKEGLTQQSDPKKLEKIISEVLSKNQDKLTQYKSGKVKLFGYFVGEVMKVSKGKANPQLVNEILKTKLK